MKNEQNKNLLQYKNISKKQAKVLGALGHIYLGVTFLDMPLGLYYHYTGGRAFFIDVYNAIKYVITLPF